MVQQDDRILEYLAEEGWATPAHLAREATVDVSPGYVSDRLQFLGYAGFVDRIHADIWEVTRWGLLYLDGELDAQNQPTPTVQRVFSDGQA